MARRRVVVNGRFLAQPATGVQRYAVQTLRALDRLLGRSPQLLRGTDWVLAVPHDAAERDDFPLVDHFEIKVLQFLRGHAWEQIPLASLARGAYLVNFSYSGPWFQRRQLITLHDAAPRAEPATYARSYRWLFDATVARLGPRVDTVMTPSRHSAQELKRRYGLLRPMLVGCGGWEHALLPFDPGTDAAVLARHGLEPGRYLLAVGSPKPSKNFDLVVRALKRLGPEAALPFAVVGHVDPAVYSGATALDATRARMLGARPDAELFALYRHAAWFVIPSRVEGFGLPALEAMAHGCPVLAARAGALPEVCGDAAVYFDPHDPASLADRLREVSAPGAEGLRAELRRRGQARLATFGWETNARILLDRLVAVGAAGGAPVDTGPDTVPALGPGLPSSAQP